MLALLLAACAALGNEVHAEQSADVSWADLRRGGLSWEDVPLDRETKDNFVRSCQVAMDVGNKFLMPTSPLEKLCKATDHVAECRDKITAQYKEVMRRGDSLDGFCGSAYEWFQEKYGDLCPKQCKKYMCKATCKWLEEKARVKKQGKSVFDATEKVEDQKAQVTDMKTTKLQTRDKLRGLKNKHKRMVVKVKKATTYSKEAKAALGKAESAHGEASMKAGKWESESKSLKNMIMSTERTCDKKNFEFGKSEVEKKKLDKENSRWDEKMTDVKGRLKEVKTKATEMRKKIKEQQKVVEKHKEPIRAVNKEIEPLNGEINKLRNKYETEKRKLGLLQNATVANHSLHKPTDKKLQEDLVRQLREKLAEVKLAREKLITKRKSHITKLKLERKTLRKFNDKLKEIDDKLRSIKDEARNTGDSLRQAKEAVERNSKIMTETKQAADDCAAKVKDLKEQEKKALTTLKFAKKAEEERATAEKAAAEESAKEEDKLEELKAQRKDLAKGIKTADTENYKQGMDLKEQRGIYKKMKKKNEKNFKKAKAAKKSLNSAKPEVVMQHGLSKYGGNLVWSAVSADSDEKEAPTPVVKIKRIPIKPKWYRSWPPDPR